MLVAGIDAKPIEANEIIVDRRNQEINTTIDASFKTLIHT